MANTIRLKRASGSDPGASDLVTGELAVRTDTGKLFTKKDDNSVTEIGATVGSNAVNTAAIQDDAVTFAKLENVENNRILGRVSSGAGNAEELTQSQTRTLLGLAASATTDTTNASNISSGTISDDRLPATISSDITGSAATLTNARSIAGTSFNGSASIDIDYNNLTNLPTIPSNTNQLTNGAGYMTATLTNEQVQDIVGGMLTGNTETGITVTYQDGDGTLDFVVGTLNQDTTGSSASCTGNSATATKLATARTIAGVSFDGSANISLNNNAITNGAGYITATLTNEQVQDIVGGMVTGNTETGITVTYQDGDGTLDFVVGTLNQDTTGSSASCTGNSATATKLATARTIAGVSFDGSANISLNNNAITNGAGYITATLTEEQVEDFVGGMVTGNTETGITVTYQDSDGTLDFVVATQSDNNFTTTLLNKLNGIATGATNVTNNNQLTNGAGYITSAVGGDSTKMPLSGGEFTGNITTHDVIPDGNNSRNLGSSSARFANLFVNDMHFANSSDNPNKVDGTWGDWTLQEGEDQIYMLNNRNGKKYKMNLTEIV